MDPSQRRIAYDNARAAVLGEIDRATAAGRIAASGVAAGSAKILVEVFLALRKGATFKRALAEGDMDYLLARLGEDDGAEALGTALNGLMRHIVYRESHDVGQRGNRALHARHFARIAEASVPARPAGTRPDEFELEVRQSLVDSRTARQRRLASAPSKPRRVPRIVFVHDRNPDVVAEVLLRANGVCELCGKAAPFARRIDGSPYLEVHHRVMLSDDGDDTVENAVAACPNCHREEHYG